MLNGIGSHIDMLPTLWLSPVIRMLPSTPRRPHGRLETFQVHLDGYNLVDYLTGEAKESPRNSIMYFSDDGEVLALRTGDYNSAGRHARPPTRSGNNRW